MKKYLEHHAELAAVRPGEQGLKAVGVVLDEDQVCAGTCSTPPPYLASVVIGAVKTNRRRVHRAVALDLDHHLHLWATCRPKFLRTIYTRRDPIS